MFGMDQNLMVGVVYSNSDREMAIILCNDMQVLWDILDYV